MTTFRRNNRRTAQDTQAPSVSWQPENMFSPGRKKKKSKNKGRPITVTTAAAGAAARAATPKAAPAYKYTNLWRKLEKYCQGRGAKDKQVDFKAR